MLKVGDTIKCGTEDEMISLTNKLSEENIETDFLYKKNGECGLWIEVTKIKRS